MGVLTQLRFMVALIFVLCVLPLMLSGCNGTGEEPASESLTSITAKGATGVFVKDLFDESNPYREQYRAWDEWTYNNAHSRPIAWDSGELPEGWCNLRGVIDENGYLIPCLEYVRMGEEAWTNGTQNEYYSKYSTIYGEGLLDPALKAECFDAQRRIKASYFPVIPDWLAADPPHRAMLVPNGDVITLGELGDYARDSAEGGGCCPGGAVCRYSSNGELIKKLDKYASWWQLYYEPNERGMPDGEFSNRSDGYIVFTDQLSDTILSIYDYDGTLLDSTIPPPARDAHNFIWLPAERIQTYHEHQNSTLSGLGGGD